ncbi:hypothetical protein [Dendronalium sp. ChiSLP03b]|uniref:hypothetical protein n=1 Tax=Dendronalium sp. ChiSLP03b TaxID=3075381 RepID=UPI002AD511B5|nr:hypothetical protein [Dendronalium sp. ChiSLP03b]
MLQILMFVSWHEVRLVTKQPSSSQVSVRLTDATWKALGIAAECLGITRADLLEQVVRENNLTFPIAPVLKQPQTNLHVEQLTVLAEQVLAQLKLGKQASSYKSAQKALRRLIELVTTSTTSK